MEFFASCPQGFESALADELREMGLRRVRKLKARVSFEGDPIDAERACLWSRLASRIFAVLSRFPCRDADELYDAVYAMPWENILRRHATIAVSASGTNRSLRNTRYSALRVKDAVCDRLADEAGTRADVDVRNPDARLSLTVHDERASLQIDLSGEPLFARTDRSVSHAAGSTLLRPDYAALVLTQAGWPRLCAESTRPVLIDICCGNGAIALEAASIACGRAPGLTRSRWGFAGWTAHDDRAWSELLHEAEARARGAKQDARIIIADPNGRAAEGARRTLGAAHLNDRVVFAQPMAERILAKVPDDATVAFASDLTKLSLNDSADTMRLVNDLTASSKLTPSAVCALVHHGMLDLALGARPAREIAVKPNNEDARLVVFESAGLGTKTGATPQTAATVDVGEGDLVAVLIPESDQFAARLKKVARTRRRWAKREGITCYRVYDADLPDYSAAIDLYEGAPDTPGRWLVIAEYAAPRSVDPSLAQARMLDMLAIAPRVLKVAPDHVAARSRTRARGGSQYATGGGAKSGGSGSECAWKEREVHILEGGLTFTVDFDSYLDTGIFLDHRITRDLVRAHAAGCQRFLNLFAYTGTATCYAAAGGACSTTTVDLSNTYLDWARHNMAQNGFTGDAHRFVRADVLAWVERQRRAHRTWDLIFCDPPTFSNSAKMGERTWDVQRDHVWLLSALVDLLTPDGLAIFSCNLRTFKIDAPALARAGIAIEDITEQTIPEDFSRNKRIHRCFSVRHL